MRLYEEAIWLARNVGFIQYEGLAVVRAARFCAARGLQRSADAHLKSARRCFVSWGADGKVRQLDQFHPHLSQVGVASDPTSTVGAPVEQLDVATVMKASQSGIERDHAGQACSTRSSAPHSSMPGLGVD